MSVFPVVMPRPSVPVLYTFALRYAVPDLTKNASVYLEYLPLKLPKFFKNSIPISTERFCRLKRMLMCYF